MSETVNGEIGRRLRKVRLMLGIKVKDMAGGLGLTVGHYRKLERGEHSINASLLTMLHGKYGIDLNYLITGKAREEDLAKDLMCGNPEEMFFLLHRILNSCEEIHRDDVQEEDEDGDEEHC